jgi:hypothetical protein
MVKKFEDGCRLSLQDSKMSLCMARLYISELCVHSRRVSLHCSSESFNCLTASLHASGRESFNTSVFIDEDKVKNLKQKLFHQSPDESGREILLPCK